MSWVKDKSLLCVFFYVDSGVSEEEGRREEQGTRRGFDRDPMVFHHTPLMRRITQLDNDRYSPMGLVFTIPRFLLGTNASRTTFRCIFNRMTAEEGDSGRA